MNEKSFQHPHFRVKNWLIWNKEAINYTLLWDLWEWFIQFINWRRNFLSTSFSKNLLRKIICFPMKNNATTFVSLQHLLHHDVIQYLYNILFSREIKCEIENKFSFLNCWYRSNDRFAGQTKNSLQQCSF